MTKNGASLGDETLPLTLQQALMDGFRLNSTIACIGGVQVTNVPLPLGTVQVDVNNASGWQLAGFGLQRPNFQPLAAKCRVVRELVAGSKGIARQNHNLALTLPIRRSLVQPDALAADEREKVRRALISKYGKAVDRLTFIGLFRAVPIACLESLRVEASTRACEFKVPSGMKAGKMQEVCSVALAHGDSGQTYLAQVRQ